MVASAAFLHGCGQPKPADSAADADKDFGKVLANYGFVELRPPSTLLPPGTIVRLKRREPLQAGIVCTQKASLGAALDLSQSDSKATSVGSIKKTIRARTKSRRSYSTPVTGVVPARSGARFS